MASLRIEVLFHESPVWALVTMRHSGHTAPRLVTTRYVSAARIPVCTEYWPIALKSTPLLPHGLHRCIVCATTEVELVWPLILGRIATAVLAHVSASMWGTMAGRSPHEAIFLQVTALDMNPYQMIFAALDVRGAFPHAPHLLLTEVWDAMGFPFLPFMTGYVQTWLYTIITATGLTA